MLYLLNDPGAAPETPGTVTNLGGLALIAVTTVTAGAFVREQVATLGPVGDPVGAFVVAFAVVLAGATLLLLAKTLRAAVSPRPTASQ